MYNKTQPKTFNNQLLECQFQSIRRNQQNPILLIPDYYRRYSEIPYIIYGQNQQIMNNKQFVKKKARNSDQKHSRVSQVKTQLQKKRNNQMNRDYSNSKAYNNKQKRPSTPHQLKKNHNFSFFPSSNQCIPGPQVQLAFQQTGLRRIEQILNKKNQNLQQQNDYLKSQIRKLYERQSLYKIHLKQYKAKLKLIKLSNEIYQNRYYELKSYVIEIMAKLMQMANDNQNQKENQRLISNCSKELIQKLKEELYGEDGIEEIKLTQKKQIAIHQDKTINDWQKDFENMNKFEHLKANIRFFPSHPSSSPSQNNLQKISKQRTLTEPLDTNSHLKQKIFQEQTSQSTQYPNINHQIQELTDQTEALMYEFRKSGNKDIEIKKKIIKISQKIRQLKAEKNLHPDKLSSLHHLLNK